MARFDRDHLPPEREFKPYRKTSLTMIAGPFAPPIEVVTREGDVLNSDEPAYIALDADDWPYPIAASVVERTYEPVAVFEPPPAGVQVGGS